MKGYQSTNILSIQTIDAVMTGYSSAVGHEAYMDYKSNKLFE